MIRLLIMFIAITLTTGFAYASAPIPLLAGKILPKGNLIIHLDGLTKNTTYDVMCDIENPMYSKTYPAVIKIYPATSAINGKTSRFGQFKLDMLSSKFFTTITTGRDDTDRPDITFTNYDDTDTIYVKNCIADYTT